MIHLRFLGGAQTVTGSKFALEVGDCRVLIDCGLFQGLKELRVRNWGPLPLPPDALDAIILTHAHIDHTGYIPRLVRQGYERPIFGSRATVDLCRLLLPDSAQLQEEDARHATHHGYSKHEPALPLYTVKDAKAALRLMKGVAYGSAVQLSPSLEFRLVPAGHILGSSFVHVTCSEDRRAPRRLLFSGDLGRYNEPVLNDPTPAPEADYLVIESTYGDRLHSHEDPKARLEEIITSTAGRGGQVIIPAFAVGRTQHLLYLLRELEEEGRIPILPVRVDSPMAVDATEKYLVHTEDHDLDMQKLAAQGRNPFRTADFQLCRSLRASRGLLHEDRPMIVISASGMATGGRVLHHLRARLPDERNTVVFVGFQAEGTRGRRLLEGESEIKIHGEMIPVRARIERIDSLSAHADQNEILLWLRTFRQPPRQTFIVHGEPRASQSLAQKIRAEVGWNVTIPALGETVRLD